MDEHEELARLRHAYGAKFNAIVAALGYLSEGLLRLEDDRDDDSAIGLLRIAEKVLIDA